MSQSPRRPRRLPPGVQIIPNLGELRRKTQSSPGRPPAQILAAMSSVMSTYAAVFEKALEGEVRIFQSIAANTNLPPTERLNALRGIAHELAGTAGTFGFALIGRVSTLFRDFADLNQPNTEVERLFADALATGLQLKGPINQAGEALIAGLLRVQEKTARI